MEVVIAGYQKKSRVLSDQEKKIVAYHETGHALVAALQTHSAPVQKITIIPRTSGALGYTCLLYTSSPPSRFQKMFTILLRRTGCSGRIFRPPAPVSVRGPICFSFLPYQRIFKYST